MANKNYRHKHPRNEGYINVSAVLSNLRHFSKEEKKAFILNPRLTIKGGDE